MGVPTPLLVKTDKAVAEHKAARESLATGLGEGGAVPVGGAVTWLRGLTV